MHNIINKKKVFSSRFSMNGSNLFQIMRVKLQSPLCSRSIMANEVYLRLDYC